MCNRRWDAWGGGGGGIDGPQRIKMAVGGYPVIKGKGVGGRVGGGIYRIGTATIIGPHGIGKSHAAIGALPVGGWVGWGEFLLLHADFTKTTS